MDNTSRKNAHALIELCRNGAYDPVNVLENVLTNWMSSDDAEEFARIEYDIDEDEYDD